MQIGMFKYALEGLIISQNNPGLSAAVFAFSQSEETRNMKKNQFYWEI